MTEKLEKIPYGQHFVDDDDIAAVVDVLENRFLTQGSLVTDFEKCIAN
jgi:dTDP-4-amino-4,6-dideoxygalactose transaminase